MKIAIVGTRGIPAKYGGFETFAQEISVRLVEKGYRVEVYCSNTDQKINEYKGVKLIYSSTSKDISPLNYYNDTIAKATRNRNDIILCCGQGGSLGIIKQKLQRSRNIYITNSDGIEHKRTKWNLFIRLGVRFVGEFLSVLFSDYIVADSNGIYRYLRHSYNLSSKKMFIIEYGAFVTHKEENKLSVNELFGVVPNDYYLVVSRLEPENNVHVIIEGYMKANTKKELIIVGNLKSTPYVKSLLKYSSDTIRFIGGIYIPEQLTALRLNAYAYLHGHSVGGTNPSLLEALGCGNIVISHDNIFNKEVTENSMFYFDSPESCAEAINQVDALSNEQIKHIKAYAQNRIKSYYNWDRITDEYCTMFNKIITK